MLTNDTTINPDHLRITLAAMGLTDQAVSRVAGISQSTLYRWLNGSVPIHPGIMLLLEILTLEDVWNHPGVSQRVANALNRK